MRVLVTRPREDGAQTAALLRAAGHDALLAPLLETHFLPGPELDLAGVAAILATSANGVRALAQRAARRDLPLFAVGPQTAAAAREAGFAHVENADGDARALGETVARRLAPDAGVLLHASGQDSVGALAEQLARAGFRVRRDVLYAVLPLPLSPAAVEALRADTVRAALFYSTRSAALFRESLARESLTGEALTAFCISQATAEALAPLAFRALRVAARPNQDALLALLDRR